MQVFLGDPAEAIRDAFEDDEHKFGEYLVLQITEGGAYVLELATLEVLPLLDCSSKSFHRALNTTRSRGAISSVASSRSTFPTIWPAKDTATPTTHL